MTRMQRKRLFKVIQGGKQDEPTLIDLAFAPCWWWLEILKMTAVWLHPAKMKHNRKEPR